MAHDLNDGDAVTEMLRLGLRNKWYCIAPSSEVKDQPIALTRLGERLVLWRDGGGKVHVQEDLCPPPRRGAIAWHR